MLSSHSSLLALDERNSGVGRESGSCDSGVMVMAVFVVIVVFVVLFSFVFSGSGGVCVGVVVWGGKQQRRLRETTPREMHS